MSEENENIIEIDAAKQVGPKDTGESLDEACPYRQHSGQNKAVESKLSLLIDLIYLTRETFLKGKAQYCWPPWINYFGSAAFSF